VERAAQGLGGGEAVATGDGLDRFVPLRQRAPGRLDAHLLDVCRRRHAEFGREAALQVTRAQPGVRGEARDVVPGPGIGVDRADGGPHRVRRRLSRPQRHAELRLPTRAAQEQHQPAGHLVRDVPAQVVLHEGERQIHPGRHPGRRPHRPVPDEDRVAVHAHLGVLPGQLLLTRPVRGDPPPVQQARRRQQEHPAAHRGHPPGACRRGRDPGDERLVLPGPVDAPAADHHERVRPRRVEVRHAVGGVHDQSAHRPDRPRPGGHDLAGVLARAVEHLVRSGEVERLEAVEDDEDDTAIGHAPHAPSARGTASTTRIPQIAPWDVHRGVGTTDTGGEEADDDLPDGQPARR
jgi:hypothetical protein